MPCTWTRTDMQACKCALLHVQVCAQAHTHTFTHAHCHFPHHASPCRCSFTASTTSAVVRFTNEATQEYTFYELEFVAGPPPKQGVLALKCPVRTTTEARVAIRNPLDTGRCGRAPSVERHAEGQLRCGPIAGRDARGHRCICGGAAGRSRLRCAPRCSPAPCCPYLRARMRACVRAPYAGKHACAALTSHAPTALPAP